MKRKTTPATAQAKIENSTPLAETLQAGFNYQIHSTGDSVWIVAIWPSGGRAAFRAAFAPDCNFSDVAIKEQGGSLIITASAGLGVYTVKVNLLEKKGSMMRYTTTCMGSSSIALAICPFDIVPLANIFTGKKNTQKTHAYRIGKETCQIYFSLTAPNTGSVFYMQNAEALSEFCKAAGTDMVQALDRRLPFEEFFGSGVGKKRIHTNTDHILCDSVVMLSETVPANGQSAELFSEFVSKASKHIAKSSSEFIFSDKYSTNSEASRQKAS